MSGSLPATGLAHQCRLLGVAVEFLTRLPVPTRRRPNADFNPQWLNASVRYFPVVGALIGVAGALVWWGALQVWPPLIAALLAIATTAVLTGAFHEDGLADTLDALGGATTRVRALEIMKDSRIGTYGALGLGLVTAIRVLALAALAPAAGDAGPGAAGGAWLGAAALISAHVLGRCAAVLVMVRCPYAGDAEHAKAKPLATTVTAGTGGIALLLTAAVVLPLAVVDVGSVGLAVVVALIIGILMVRWLRRRLGGYTGDTLGATEQLTEAAVLLAWCAQ
ncbi:MAG: adenosylcobinamide-GDP ribazoletransferase [Actinomycetales bacterium]|nr:adenosylcobinamide-GDP ribazoletransferase [Actinomycetales bacterium]